ncbi:MAG: hypothetical protein GX937_08065 [Lentisphaerae bacterium]|jgi:polygalacturonase|nr:hypothetical protein [Lentisphaerota bacterium]
MFVITDFGALGDGQTLNTVAIQKAVDTCSQSGGGRVLVPAGLFITGSIWLRDNVELHLCNGAILRGSSNLDDYNRDDAFPQNMRSEQEQWNGSHLLLGVEVSNVSITGPGCIDGNCEAFFEAPVKPRKPSFSWSHGMRKAKDKERLRPGQMIMFSECRDIRMSDLDLRNSCCWTCLFHGCQDVFVSGLKIRNPIDGGNTDGIDIDCCRRVIVRDCNIRTGDDGITLRGSFRTLKDKSGICENVTISNCVIDSSVCAFRIGVGEGYIRNVAISNIVIERAGTGFLLQSAYSPNAPRGVDISEIAISNIQAQNLAYPLRIISGYPTATAKISHIRVNGFYGRCHGNCVFQGNDQTRPRDIRLSNCDFSIVPAPIVLESAEDYPQYFLQMDRVDAITLDNFNIQWREQDATWKGAIHKADVSDINVNSNCHLNEPW